MSLQIRKLQYNSKVSTEFISYHLFLDLIIVICDSLVDNDGNCVILALNYRIQCCQLEKYLFTQQIIFKFKFCKTK